MAAPMNLPLSCAGLSSRAHHAEVKKHEREKITHQVTRTPFVGHLHGVGPAGGLEFRYPARHSTFPPYATYLLDVIPLPVAVARTMKYT